MRTTRLIGLLTVVCLFAAACGDDTLDSDDPDPVIEDTERLGGNLSVYDASIHDYSIPAPYLTPEQLVRHREGAKQFAAVFVADPNESNSGLGPVFNANSCMFCHPAGGRAPAPLAGGAMGSLLIRVSLPAASSFTSGPPTPLPGYGDQINDQAVFGVQPEARISIDYIDRIFPLQDGTSVSLRQPDFMIEGYEPIPPIAEFSARMPRPVFGSGLLEAIPLEAIMIHSDPVDDDGDGISGRPNYVLDRRTGEYVIGRFGWKGNEPNLRQQTAGAYHNDMGLTSSLFPTESAYGQVQDDGASNRIEISDETLDAVTFFMQTLAVPARRNVDDPQVIRGELLFDQAGCAKCHTPTFVTGDFPDVPQLSNQTIHPYSDMLLHDLGTGLSDRRPDFIGYGQEWRTTPLWGIGLSATVNGHTNFLHDGRAQLDGGDSLACRRSGGVAQKRRGDGRSRPSGVDRVLEFALSSIYRARRRNLVLPR
ncbi:MAG: thiol oxidoreductase [Candidatus Poribacteria bacterium]|nr:thiol oxidoreductase [Candidatus Poribacteria bacterium]